MPPKKIKHDWSWIEEVKDVKGITDEHRLKAAGLADVVPCTYIFPAIDGDPHPVKERKCNAGYCYTNPACYNYVGVKELLDPGGKGKYVEHKLHNRITSRKEGIPAGLRNLGATCYANAFLQLWFHNIPFRNAIYACSPVEGSPLYHLAHVFASLQFTEKPFVDPMALIESLRLNKGEQQDAAEFSKLFLDMITNELLKQKDEKLRSLTRDLFEGTIQYTTKCDCGFASQRDTSFLELELSLKEGTSLEDRLAHSLSDERLEGDNQYFCQACGIKRDATRSAEITSLPPVLHFSLLRFVFDPKTFERRKSRASITFPIVTQLGGHSYRLQAIITHSGPSAHEGHFVCEAKDMSSGKWYMCDDEDVSVIARSGALNGNGDGNSNGHVPQFGFGAGSRGGPPRKRPRTDENTLKSKDAYMLVYNRLADQQTSPPPVDIKQKVDLEVAEWFNGQGRQELEKIRLEDEYAGLVGAKRQVARLLPGMDCLVPTAQLERWFGAKKLDELFKPWDIPVCPHGDVDPDSTGRYKMISLDAFEVLQHYGFGIPSGWRPANEARPMAKRPQREVIDLSIDSPAADPTSISERAPVEVVNGNGKRTYLPSFDGVTDSTTPVDKPASDLQSHDLSDRAKAPPESFDLSEKRTAIASSSKSTNTGVDMSRSSTTQSGTQTFDILPRMTICPICVEAEYKSRTAPGMSKEDKELWKAEIKIDRQIIKFLDQKFITYGVDYYYLPDSFVERWMDFIKSEHAPRPILEADLGRCEHGLLDVDLEMDPIHRIPRNGWDQIVEKYGNAQPVTFRFPGTVPPGNTKRSAKTDISVRTCVPCRYKRLSDFEEAEVFIIMERTSVPTSRRSKNKEVSYDVKKTTSVVDIKVEIMHQTGITPINLTLYHNDRELQNEETVASIPILAGDQIRAKEMDVVTVDDDEPVVVERGFGGTALHGRISCPECTYQNQGEALCCEMCGHPFGFKDQ